VDWQGKVAVVTGGASGIGAATAQLFSSHGAHVVVVDRDPGVGAADADQILLVRADVSCEADVERVRQATVERFGRIDVLVNNAGIMRRHEQPFDWTVAEIEEVLNANLLSQFVTTQVLGPVMAQGGGSIVNIASMGATMAVPYSPAYTASKAGVLGMTRSVAAALAPSGIRVNAVLPGFVDTPMTAASPARGSMPIMAPGDVARAIVHVAGDPSLQGGFFAVEIDDDGVSLNRIDDTPRFTRVEAF